MDNNLIFVRSHLRRAPEADPSWREQAACQGMPTELFFPDRGRYPKGVDRTEHPRSVCSDCLVTQQCLSYGLQEMHGVWGGTSSRERRIMRRGVKRG